MPIEFLICFCGRSDIPPPKYRAYNKREQLRNGEAAISVGHECTHVVIGAVGIE